MSKAEIAILCIAIFQGFCIFLGNLFTVFVFWIHRHKLKRGSILLINLAVTDLLVGLTQIAMVGTIAFPHITGVRKVIISDEYTPDISTCFKAVFSTASVFFSRSHFTGTSLRFDVASSTSRNKHQHLHLQCFTRMDSCNNSGCILFVGCARCLEI